MYDIIAAKTVNTIKCGKRTQCFAVVLKSSMLTYVFKQVEFLVAICTALTEPSRLS